MMLHSITCDSLSQDCDYMNSSVAYHILPSGCDFNVHAFPWSINVLIVGIQAYKYNEVEHISGAHASHV